MVSVRLRLTMFTVPFVTLKIIRFRKKKHIPFCIMHMVTMTILVFMNNGNFYFISMLIMPNYFMFVWFILILNFALIEEFISLSDKTFY